MGNRRTIGIILLAAVVLLLLGHGRLTAQNESGRRNINKEAFQRMRYWYESYLYETQYPIIRSLPPLSITMPWDIMASYIYMDSLARFDSLNLTEKTLNNWRYERTVNDTLRGMAKYIYKMSDYDPNIFTQYIDEVGLNRGTRYTASLRTVIAQVGNTIFDALPSTEHRAGLLALLESSNILRIKVRSIDSMPTHSSSRSAKYLYQVTADVLDTLKGQVFVSCPQVQQSFQQKTNSTARPLANSPVCIQFVYINGLYFNPRNIPSGAPELYTARDPEFAFGRDSLFTMKVGQEAVIFVRHNGGLVDSTHDYYHIRLEERASFGALPIINGQVRDINHIWSSELMLSYEEWKTQFMMLRNRLLSGAY